jgi:non-heme chloroperoxidase
VGEPAEEGQAVGYITVGAENSERILLYYQDHGVGQPVVLIHGYPLSGQVWEKQGRALLRAGYRVITYDRRGFGASSKPSVGYDFDTLAHDLSALLTALDLQDTALVGHSMGTGEVTRYLGTYGATRVRKVALLAPLPPFLLRTADNPAGIRQSVFDNIMRAVMTNRPTYMQAFLDDCFNRDVLEGIRLSEQDAQYWWNIAMSASATAAVSCVAAWLTDFRQDVRRLTAETLIVQGDQDRMYPIHATGRLLAPLIQGAQFVIIEGGPHAIIWTHADEVNHALLDFLGR